MSKSNWITIWGVAAGLFFTTIGSSLVLAFKIGGVNEKVSIIERDIGDLKNSIGTLDNRVGKVELGMAEMQVKLDVLWRVHLSKATSSIELTDDELKALKTSGVDSFVNNHYSEILKKVTKLEPDNQNQARELLISVINRYKKEDVYRKAFLQASISSGHDIDSLLLIAALSIRDKVVLDLGFSLDNN